jgi:hypothetical protein
MARDISYFLYIYFHSLINSIVLILAAYYKWCSPGGGGGCGVVEGGQFLAGGDEAVERAQVHGGLLLVQGDGVVLAGAQIELGAA